MGLFSYIDNKRERKPAFDFAYSLTKWPAVIGGGIVLILLLTWLEPIVLGFLSAVVSGSFSGVELGQLLPSSEVFLWIGGWGIITTLIFCLAYLTELIGKRYPLFYYIIFLLPLSVVAVIYFRWTLTVVDFPNPGMAILAFIVYVALGIIFFGGVFAAVIPRLRSRYNERTTQLSSSKRRTDLVALVLLFVVAISGTLLIQERFLEERQKKNQIEKDESIAEYRKDKERLQREIYTIENLDLHWKVDGNNVSLNGVISASGMLAGRYSQTISVDLGRGISVIEEKTIMLTEDKEEFSFTIESMTPEIQKWMEKQLVDVNARVVVPLRPNVTMVLRPISISSEPRLLEYSFYRSLFSREDKRPPEATVRWNNGRITDISLE